MTRAQLKEKAKEQLRGNWVWAILLSFISWLIIYLVSDISSFITSGQDRIYKTIDQSINGVNYTQVLSTNYYWGNALNFVIALFTGVLAWGVAFTILHFRDTGDKTDIFKGLFAGYTDGHFESTFLTYLLTTIFTTLWTFLFVIPGIIKGYSYGMTAYILKDMFDAGHKPTATEAITKSRELMNGHKAELFVLDLSFIGWYLLGVITIGIGLLWVVPYYRQTRANFYRNLAGDQFKK